MGLPPNIPTPCQWYSRSMSAAARTSSSSTCPHSSKPLVEVSTVDARSCWALISRKKSRRRPG